MIHYIIVIWHWREKKYTKNGEFCVVFPIVPTKRRGEKCCQAAQKNSRKFGKVYKNFTCLFPEAGVIITTERKKGGCEWNWITSVLLIWTIWSSQVKLPSAASGKWRGSRCGVVFIFSFCGQSRRWGRPSFFALICRNRRFELANQKKSSGNTTHIYRNFLGKT